MPGPAIRRASHPRSPRARDPTAGGRDGIVAACLANTASSGIEAPISQAGLVSCDSLRQPEHGGQGGIEQVPSLAPDRLELKSVEFSIFTK